MRRLRWAIVGTGIVARKFAHGLRLSADSEVTMVISRSSANAVLFAREMNIPHSSNSLEQATQDTSIDAFYIATPPSAHHKQALQCINAGKPVLIEKPFALNAAQAQEIAAAAQARSVFCMEAMWTRFLPLAGRLRQMIKAGAIGQIRTMTGSFCIAEAESCDTSIQVAALGGGALLHRGIYPISLAYYLLGAPSSIFSIAKIGTTGVDEDVGVLLGYDCGAQALFHASLRTQSANDFVIEGTEGRIHVRPPIYSPFRMTLAPIRPRNPPSPLPSPLDRIKQNHRIRGVYQRVERFVSPFFGPKSIHFACPYSGNGYQYEADEVVRCIREGEQESPVMPLSESVDIMRTMDRIREQWTEASHAREKLPHRQRR